jgi:hypothetical protein
MYCPYYTLFNYFDDSVPACVCVSASVPLPFLRLSDVSRSASYRCHGVRLGRAILLQRPKSRRVARAACRSEGTRPHPPRRRLCSPSRQTTRRATAAAGSPPASPNTLNVITVAFGGIPLTSTTPSAASFPFTDLCRYLRLALAYPITPFPTIACVAGADAASADQHPCSFPLFLFRPLINTLGSTEQGANWL